MLKFYKMNNLVQAPVKATEGSACFDIHAWLEKPILVPARRGVRLVPTGLILDIPEGHSVRLHPRSGLAIKHGITLINAEGVIDSDYVNELMVPLINFGPMAFQVTPGMRICQAELVETLRYTCTETVIKPTQKTTRDGGFGSTGTS